MTRRFATPTYVAAVVGLCAMTLTGCGAGLSSATAKEHGSVQGQSANQGTIEIRDSQVVADDQMEGVIEMTVINTGSDADALTSVTTGIAGAVVVMSDASGKSLDSVPLPTNTPVEFSTTGTTLDIGDLTSNLQPGTYVSVTLNFQIAGAVTVQMPVEEFSSPSASPAS